MTDKTPIREAAEGGRMKVLVCGGRDFNDKTMIYNVLNNRMIQANGKITHIIHGNARGADTLAGQWARETGVQEVSCPANWQVYGRRAGFLRNKAMLDLLNPEKDIVIAFPGGRGTEMMVDIAKKANVTVRRIMYAT